MLLLNLTVSVSSLLWYSGLPQKYRIYLEIPGENIFLAFRSIQYHSRFSMRPIPNFTVSASLRHLFFRMTTKIPNLKGIAGRNYFFCFSVNSLSITVFDDADYQFYGFSLIRIMVFRITAKNTEFTGKYRKKLSFSFQ